MSQESLESVLDAARKLSLEEQRRLAEQIIKELGKSQTIANRMQRALEAVERTRGSMKGLDRDTIIWLAEDEELCGY